MTKISNIPVTIPDGNDLILGSQINDVGDPITKNFTVQSIADLATGSGGGDVPPPATLYVDTEISSAQLLDLHNTPVYILPQPTNGEIYVIDRVLLRYSFGTISYSPSSMQLKCAYYTDSVKADDATQTMFISEGIPQFTRSGIDGNPVPISQSGIALYTSSAITGGDGTMKARTYYSVIPADF